MPDRQPTMPDLVLHIGAHRTGTTALQIWLDQNRATLMGEGIGFWALDAFRRWLAAGLFYAEGGAPDDGQGFRIAAARIRAEAGILAREGLRLLIVSEENMIGSVGSNLSAQGFYPEAPARLQRFRDVFGQVPLRVVLTVRALPDYWTSALTYAVATGRKFPDAPTLEALSQAQRGWADLARETARVFPQSQVLVADYAEWATRPDAFLALLAGRPVGTLPRRMARHHVSPLLDGLRKRLAGRGDAAGLELLGTGTGKWQPFSAAQLQRLGAQHAADMAKLATGLTGARLVHPPAEG